MTDSTCLIRQVGDRANVLSKEGATVSAAEAKERKRHSNSGDNHQ
ncbi:MAG TPA: hypothetical protein VH500_04410 [Nitrososphaeraceae archaeon]